MAVRGFFGRKAAALVTALAVTQGHTVGHTMLSDEGYASLASSEAIVLTPYEDIAGIKTVCAGETEGIEDRQYTPQECFDLLIARVERDFAEPAARCTAVWDTLHQKTKDALIEFAYNLGAPTYCKSSIRKRLDAGRGIAACERILLYNKARINGKLQEVKGLTDRRIREAHKCREGFTLTAPSATA